MDRNRADEKGISARGTWFWGSIFLHPVDQVLLWSQRTIFSALRGPVKPFLSPALKSAADWTSENHYAAAQFEVFVWNRIHVKQSKVTLQRHPGEQRERRKDRTEGERKKEQWESKEKKRKEEKKQREKERTRKREKKKEQREKEERAERERKTWKEEQGEGTKEQRERKGKKKSEDCLLRCNSFPVVSLVLFCLFCNFPPWERERERLLSHWGIQLQLLNKAKVLLKVKAVTKSCWRRTPCLVSFPCSSTFSCSHNCEIQKNESGTVSNSRKVNVPFLVSLKNVALTS